MANHKSSIKRIRTTERKKSLNRYQETTAKGLIKTLRGTKDKAEAQKLLLKVNSTLDRLAKKNIIHKKNASNRKSKLTKLVSALV